MVGFLLLQFSPFIEKSKESENRIVNLYMFSLRGRGIVFPLVKQERFFSVELFSPLQIFSRDFIDFILLIIFAGPFQTFNAISGIVHKVLASEKIRTRILYLSGLSFVNYT